MKRASLLILVAGITAGAVTSLAQSPNPFGIPSADQPNPGSAIDTVPGSRAQGWLVQGRSEVLARHGIVATSDPLAAQAGLEILQQGRQRDRRGRRDRRGARRHVAERHRHRRRSVRARLWSAKDKKLYALNSGGWAPAGWTPEFFTGKLGVKSVPGSGVNAATVPGAISGYDALLKRFGTMTFKETFERAARIADEGWGQAERRHSDLRGATNGLRADPDSRQTFLEGDRRARRCTASSATPALAKALRLLQKHGRDAFYGRHRRGHRRARCRRTAA